MFENQYFAHDSPSGVKVGDLADTVGYDFIAIGENLALGNFENDEALVQAWMDSPGHRANILNSRYQEIGVAVLKGTFEGRTTWLAVQHFGLSVAVCPQPDETIKINIESSQSKIAEIFDVLKALEAELKKMNPRQNPDYQEKINQYNGLVTQYNLLVAQTKAVIDRCRAAVAADKNFFKYKVGMGIALGGDRNGGQEAALTQIHTFYILNGMIPVSGGFFGANLGATFWTKDNLESAKLDEEGFKSLKKTVKRFAEFLKKAM